MDVPPLGLFDISDIAAAADHFKNLLMVPAGAAVTVAGERGVLNGQRIIKIVRTQESESTGRRPGVRATRTGFVVALMAVLPAVGTLTGQATPPGLPAAAQPPPQPPPPPVPEPPQLLSNPSPETSGSVGGKGIAVGEVKLFDERLLTAMVESLEAQLATLHLIDQNSLATAIGRLQGANISTSSMGFTATGLPTARVATTEATEGTKLTSGSETTTSESQEAGSSSTTASTTNASGAIVSGSQGATSSSATKSGGAGKETTGAEATAGAKRTTEMASVAPVISNCADRDESVFDGTCRRSGVAGHPDRADEPVLSDIQSPDAAVAGAQRPVSLAGHRVGGPKIRFGESENPVRFSP